MHGTGAFIIDYNPKLQEKRISEGVVEDMSDEQKMSYLKLKDLNEHLLQELSIGQAKLVQLSLRKSELEADICTSKVGHEPLIFR